MKKHSAFTLLELSIVILIISALLVGVLKGKGIVNKSRLHAAQMQTAQSPVNDIPNLVAWYETAAERSFDAAEAVDGATVSTWYDLNPQSLAAVNATQSDSGHKPLYSANVHNSLPMLKFDSATNRYFSMADGTVPYDNRNYTIFFVGKTTVSSCNLCTVIYSGSNSSNNSNAIFYQNSTILNSWYSNDVSASVAPTNIHIFSFTYNSTAGRTIYIDGTSSATSAAVNRASTSGSNYIGGISTGSGLDGYLGEVIIFERYLKPEERKSVEKYLSRKWGIAVS